MRNLLVVTFILFSTATFAITIEEAVRKMKQNYSTVKLLEYSSIYELYKGHDSKEIYSSYDGYMYRDDNRVYQKIDQTEFVYGKGFFLQISNKERAILLDSEQIGINMILDTNLIFSDCHKNRIESNGSCYTLTFEYATGNTSPLSKLIIKLDKSSFDIVQLDFFYSSMEDFSEDFRVKDLAQPHLLIKFTDISRNPKDKSNLFSLNRYMRTENNLLTPIGEYKNYDLIDNRLN